MEPEAQADGVYVVLMNEEEQYSLWPRDLGVPAGWLTVGEAGPKAQCLEYIRKAWVDMRPRSLRQVLGKSR